MISRTILPVTYQQDVFPGSGHQFGLGDITQSLFFSPKAPGPGGIVWGAGPAFLVPTATDKLLGTGKFGIGPTLVALKQSHGWTYGLLANQIWSESGDASRRAVSNLFLQPFLTYTTHDAWTYGVNTESSYDWERASLVGADQRLRVEAGEIDKQPVSFQIGARYWADSPVGGPHNWGGRVAVVLLFPQGQ